MRHELWEDPEPSDGGYLTFCLAGPMGDDARASLSPKARLTWTVAAPTHFEAITLHYEHMGWGKYTSDFPEIDREACAARGWE